MPYYGESMERDKTKERQKNKKKQKKQNTLLKFCNYSIPNPMLRQYDQQLTKQTE